MLAGRRARRHHVSGGRRAEQVGDQVQLRDEAAGVTRGTDGRGYAEGQTDGRGHGGRTGGADGREGTRGTGGDMGDGREVTRGTHGR